jgi:hypothetical protein
MGSGRSKSEMFSGSSPLPLPGCLPVERELGPGAGRRLVNNEVGHLVPDADSVGSCWVISGLLRIVRFEVGKEVDQADLLGVRSFGNYLEAE